MNCLLYDYKVRQLHGGLEIGHTFKTAGGVLYCRVLCIKVVGAISSDPTGSISAAVISLLQTTSTLLQSNLNHNPNTDLKPLQPGNSLVKIRRRHVSCRSISQRQHAYNPFVIVILLDFSKAFDTVRHSTLLAKMAELELLVSVYN